MEVIFNYQLNKEFQNFKNSFNSANHSTWSERQEEFFAVFSELTRESAQKFAEDYIADHKIDMTALLKQIEDQWHSVEKEFFRRADLIYRSPLPQKRIDVYLTVHDRCSYNFERNEFFVHLNLKAANKTIMHELWHWYFYYTVGKKIGEEYGHKIFNDLKEALTVVLNIDFIDLLGETTDKGYPQHEALRETIKNTYAETKDIYKTINRTLKKP